MPRQNKQRVADVVEVMVLPTNRDSVALCSRWGQQQWGFLRTTRNVRIMPRDLAQSHTQAVFNLNIAGGRFEEVFRYKNGHAVYIYSVALTEVEASKLLRSGRRLDVNVQYFQKQTLRPGAFPFDRPTLGAIRADL